MESLTNVPPLIVIVGQTASGKSELALQLAKRYNGEIICADSRTVYRGMDIGTAKPSQQDQKLVPHHLLDIAEPDQPITAADFKQRAQERMQDIASRGKTAFLVGGTGLYIDAVLFNFSFSSSVLPGIRQELNKKSVQELQTMLLKKGLALPENTKNPRHLIRQLETGGVSNQKTALRQNTLVLSTPFLDQPTLKERLTRRLNGMLKQGLEKEVQTLVARFGWDCPALQTIGYQEFKPYFAGEVTLGEVKTAVVQHSIQYARRQKTWFKRNRHLHLIYKKEDAVDLITSLLNKNYIA